MEHNQDNLNFNQFKKQLRTINKQIKSLKKKIIRLEKRRFLLGEEYPHFLTLYIKYGRKHTYINKYKEQKTGKSRERYNARKIES